MAPGEAKDGCYCQWCRAARMAKEATGKLWHQLTPKQRMAWKKGIEAYDNKHAT